MADLQVTDPILDEWPTASRPSMPDVDSQDKLTAFHATVPNLRPPRGPLSISAANRTELRRVVLRSARVCLEHAASSHYTEGALRWWGITHQDRAINGQYPLYADCSSFFTWCHWDGSRWLKLADYVNGLNWTAGYTGTSVLRGERVSSVDELFAGDAVFYGHSQSVPSHMALYIGDGRVISDGSEAAPQLLAYDYRPDVIELRRLIY